MLIQLVNIRIRPGMREAFLEAFAINTEGTRREPGNLRFDVLCDPEDSHNLYIYEVFRDEAALEAHRQTEHYRRCVALIDPMSESRRGKQYFEAIDVQDLA